MVIGKFGDGKTDLVEAADVLAPGVGEIAAGHLRATFHQMAGAGGRRQMIEVADAPAKGVHRRANHQGRIGAASGDHHIGASVQRLGDGRAAEIDIGRDHPAGGGVKPLQGGKGAQFAFRHHAQ